MIDRRPGRRLVLLQVVVFAMVTVLLGRLWYVQVARAGDARPVVTDGGRRTVALPTVRGRILDAQRRPLVDNASSVVVTVDPGVNARLPAGERTAVFARLGRLLGEPAANVEARTVPCGTPGARRPPLCWNGTPYEPVPVAQDVSPDVALAVMERREDFPGVVAESRPVRDFPEPFGANAAHLMGYLAPVTEEELAADRSPGEPALERFDRTGRAGLEKTYDADLRGTHGRRTVRVDPAGRVRSVLAETPSTPGNDLVTSIDARIQSVTERQLRKAIERAHGTTDRVTRRKYAADSGAAVVLDVRTGRVVAMASTPSYDPAVWSGGLTAAEQAMLFGDAVQAPLLSRAIQGEYAPGSTFKVVPAAAALASGYPTSTVLPCPPSLSIAGRTFRNFESRSYGPVSFARALAVSCDTFFYRIGLDLRRSGAIAETARAFGLGGRTGIDLPGEGGGRITGHTPYAGNAALLAIGQGDTLVTPLQLAVAYAAIANGGTLWEPRIGEAVVGPDGSVVRPIAPKRVGKLPLTPRQLRYLRDALRETTRSGTGAAPFLGFPLDEVRVASKTGTSEVAGRQTTSWFASFDSRYAVVMMVSQGGTGSGTSGPSVRAIWETLYGLPAKGPRSERR